MLCVPKELGLIGSSSAFRCKHDQAVKHAEGSVLEDGKCDRRWLEVVCEDRPN